VAEHNPNPATGTNAAPGAGIPGSTAPAHPATRIPLPAHGFETLDAPALAAVPAADVISRAAQLLITAAGEKLGLATGAEPDLDMPDARRLITALAGLLAASRDELGVHWEPLLDGLRTLQNAFREASAQPDPDGAGPGERLLS
jgi:hypothetical protein